MKAKVGRFVFGLIALAIFLVGPVIAFGGCATLGKAAQRAERPAKYGAGLEACRLEAVEKGDAGWEFYVPCCFIVSDESKMSRGECADGGAP